MKRAARMALVLSLLMAVSLPAFAVVCRVCTEEIGCQVISEPTDTWCKFVLIPANCRLVSSPGCTPADPPGMAMMGKFEVSSIEITPPAESLTIVSSYQPAVAEPATATGAPQK